MGVAIALVLCAGASGKPLLLSRRTPRAQDALRIRGGAAGGNLVPLPPADNLPSGPLPEHALTVDAVLAKLGVTTETGLTLSQVAEARKAHGRNELEAEKPTPLWQLLAAQFDDRLVQILLGVAVLGGLLVAASGAGARPLPPGMGAAAAPAGHLPVSSGPAAGRGGT